jgi:hypothetical protein
MKNRIFFVLLFFLGIIFISSCADVSKYEKTPQESLFGFKLWLGIVIFLMIIIHLSFIIYKASVMKNWSSFLQVFSGIIFSIILPFTIIGEWIYILLLWMIDSAGMTAMSILFFIIGILGSWASVFTYFLGGFVFNDGALLNLVLWQTISALITVLISVISGATAVTFQKRSGKVKESFYTGDDDIVREKNDNLFNILVQITFADGVLDKEEEKFLSEILKRFSFKQYSSNVEESIKIARDNPVMIDSLRMIFSGEAERSLFMEFSLLAAGIDANVKPAELDFVKKIQQSLGISDDRIQEMVSKLGK